MRRLLAFGIVSLLIALAPPGAQQRERCQLEIVTTPGTVTHLTKLGEGDTRLDAGGGVEATCGGKWVRADSVSWFEGRGELYLFGDVEYRDAGRTLEADQATYYRDEDRVRPEGNVQLTDHSSGSTLKGPLLDYYPQNESRPVERILAPGRPHLTFNPDTTGGDNTEPFEVDADRMHIYGDSAIAGAGRVVVVRGDLNAYGDSLDLDMGRGQLWLLRQPSVEANQMHLRGDSILVLMEDQQLREILAWPNGWAEGRELSLTAPALRLYVEAEEITRAVASAGEPARTGAVDVAGREPWARSESQDYVLVADSIDIRRPAGQLERVIAVRRARASRVQPVVPGDTLLGSDWLVGDTITGYFALVDSVPATVGEVELRRLVSAGDARALYHLRDQAGEGEAANQPAVNYVIGRVVTLWLEAGDVEDAQVVGPAIGVYNEPLPAAMDGDSLGLVPDSLAQAAQDTAGVPRDSVEGSETDTVVAPTAEARSR
ncbi:MAG: hypothetical protein JSV41_09190 [Gemmatimonadota bacterium]|nr:MAG: hypothetical protein JSV41_09190 [Gemmatimonadota bacterium]